MGCPHCGSDNVVKHGKNRLGKPYYECKVCGRSYTTPEEQVFDKTVECPNCGGHLNYGGWNVITQNRQYLCADCGKAYVGTYPNLTLKKVEMDCPYCGSNGVVKSGTYKSGMQKFRCKHCNKQFNLNTKAEKKPEITGVVCPKCQSTDLVRAGKNKYDVPTYRCKACKTKFVEHVTVRPKNIHNETCPHCGHVGAKKGGKTAKGEQYYRCGECGHKYLLEKDTKFKHLSKEDTIKIAKLKGYGMPATKIALTLGVDVRTVRNHLKKYNENAVKKVEELSKIDKYDIQTKLLLGKLPMLIAKEYNVSLADLQNTFKHAYDNELPLNKEQESLILTFGVSCGVSAEYIAPYIPCSVKKVDEYLSKYTNTIQVLAEKREKERPVLTPKDIAFDMMELDKFVGR